MLQKIDPKSAELIHKNNVKRVIRALEIAKNSKELKSTHMQKEMIRKKQESKYDFYVFCLNIERELLYKRINERVDIMVKNGVIDEIYHQLHCFFDYFKICVFKHLVEMFKLHKNGK